MFCPTCGTANPDASGFCSKCGASFQPVQSPNQTAGQFAPPSPAMAVDNNMTLAIVATVLSFCCGWLGLPFSIYALVKASAVNDLVRRGNLSQAQIDSATAKKFSVIGIIVALIGGVLFAIFRIVMMQHAFRY